MMNFIPEYRCQHCGSSYPPAAYMYHKADCPHGQIGHARLHTIPDHVLEAELEWRKSPRPLQALVESNGRVVMEHAAVLSECLCLLMKLAKLTRYRRAACTTLNVPSELLTQIDRLLAGRGVPPPEDDNAD